MSEELNGPDVAALQQKSQRELELEDKLGGRTILLILVAIVAIIELLIIVRIAV
jgi:hypothetical protein